MPARALFEHPGYERAKPVHHAPEIDVQHPVPVVERKLPDPRPLDDPSVVAQHVNRAVGIESDRGEAVDRVSIGHVGHHTGRVMPCGAKLPHGSIQPIGFDVGQHQLHPGLGEPFRHRQAKTAGRTGGLVQLLSFLSEPATINAARWLAKEVTVVASNAYTHDDFRRSMAFLADGRVQAQPLHSRTVGLSDLEATLRGLSAGPTDDIKVLVDPRRGSAG